MDGLIDQAKSQLWKIVNELIMTKKNGATPQIEVALYEYGNSGIPAGEGYIRMKTALTADLDKVSDVLFKLTTNGGDEYCGKVIKVAAQGLSWSKNNGDLKLIFIAGNEPFTQGDANYENSCKEAINKGIIVNTIFCGSFQEGVDTKWKHGADLADGKYISIDQNIKVADIKAPQDEELSKLGQELNKTYIAFGVKGHESKELQSAQDTNATKVGAPAMALRAVAKASKQYESSSWDLVDAYASSVVDVSKLKDNELPAEMKKMDVKEREAYVKNMQSKREEIQKSINTLSEKRRTYIAKEQLRQAAENTFDAGILKIIKEQAANKGYK